MRNDVQMVIDAAVAAQAKMVAASRRMTTAEYLSELLRPLVRRDLERETSKQIEASKQGHVTS